MMAKPKISEILPIMGGPATLPNAAHCVDILNGDDNIVLRLHFADATLASNACTKLCCALEHCRALENGETLALRAVFEGSPCEVTGDYGTDCAPILQHAVPIC